MDEIIKRLDKMLFWLEFIGKREAKEFLLECFSNDQEIILYQNSDGKNGYNELTKIAKMTQKTIQEFWNKWENMGILIMKSVQGGERGVRKYNLMELGIEIPEID